MEEKRADGGDDKIPMHSWTTPRVPEVVLAINIGKFFALTVGKMQGGYVKYMQLRSPFKIRLSVITFPNHRTILSRKEM